MSIPGSAEPLLLAQQDTGGYQIQRSLRFNSSDSASLSRASYAGSGTFSCWVKRCKLGTAQTITSGVSFNASDQLNSSTAVFRDPSAWMHVLVSSSGTYVNNVSVASGTAITPGVIGSGCDLYLADVYFIDGQALTPSSFTEVSATTGQLIPKAYTGTYGTNGFHLPFSDNSTTAALGTDTSGNGNDWTVNNFSVDDGSGAVYSATSTMLNPIPVFDGNPNTYGTSAFKSGGYQTVTEAVVVFTSTFSYTTNNFGNNGTRSLRLTRQSDSATTVVTTLSTSSWTIPAGFTGVAISKIEWERTFGSYENVSQVLVDGVPLIDSNGTRTDSLVDTPTSYGTDTGAGAEVRGNYCTLNPLHVGTNQARLTLSNGNLDASWAASGSVYAIVTGSIAVSSGKWYWESTQNNTSRLEFGIVPSSASLGSNYVGSIGFAYASTGFFYRYNGSTINIGTSFTTNDICGIALDLDAGKIWFSKNGTWIAAGNPASGTNPIHSGISGTFVPAYSDDSATVSSPSVSCNFGQRPFAYTAPSGFKALCGTNLPEGTITTSGSFTGNANADGPFVYLNGVPTAMTINGNAVTFGAHADKLANGFKLRTNSLSYNASGSNTYSITTTGAKFKYARAQSNP